jgi:hypothetical protein
MSRLPPQASIRRRLAAMCRMRIFTDARWSFGTMARKFRKHPGLPAYLGLFFLRSKFIT